MYLQIKIMSTTSQTSDSLYSKESSSNDFTEIDDWIASLKVIIILRRYIRMPMSRLISLSLIIEK